MSSPYFDLLEALRVSCNLPEFPNPLPSAQLDLELKNGPTITIDFNEETEFVEIFATVGTYAPEEELEVLKKIAEANFLWAATAGGTLSARPEIRTVYFSYQFPVLSLNGVEFVSLIERCVDIISQWQTLLLKDTEATTADTTEKNEEETKEPAAPVIPGENNVIMG